MKPFSLQDCDVTCIHGHRFPLVFAFRTSSLTKFGNCFGSDTQCSSCFQGLSAVPSIVIGQLLVKSHPNTDDYNKHNVWRLKEMGIRSTTEYGRVTHGSLWAISQFVPGPGPSPLFGKSTNTKMYCLVPHTQVKVLHSKSNISKSTRV